MFFSWIETYQRCKTNFPSSSSTIFAEWRLFSSHSPFSFILFQTTTRPSFGLILISNSLKTNKNSSSDSCKKHLTGKFCFATFHHCIQIGEKRSITILFQTVQRTIVMCFITFTENKANLMDRLRINFLPTPLSVDVIWNFPPWLDCSAVPSSIRADSSFENELSPW